MSESEDLRNLLRKLTEDVAPPPENEEDARVTLEAPRPDTVVLCVEGEAVGQYSHAAFDLVFNRLELLATHLIVDMARCARVSSYALGLIAALADDRKKHRWRLFVTGANRQVAFAMHSLGLERLVEERPTREEALAVLDEEEEAG